MQFKDSYPDFAAVEDHIHRARAERSVALAHAIASFGVAMVRGLKKLGALLESSHAAEHERRAIETDSFVKRWAPHH